MTIHAPVLRGLAAALCIWVVPLDARAQCGAALSQCRNCHEVRGAHPVQAGPSAWHRDHAFADLCVACHGGDPQAIDEPTAHAAMTDPLANVHTTCGACHGDDADSLARPYVSALAPSPTAPRAPAAHERRRGIAWPNVVLAAMVLFAGAGGSAYVIRNERHLRLRARGEPK